MKRGFTLIELLVVVGMLAILMGAMTTSIGKARTRAKVARATQDVKEITNAILAFENIAVGRSLEKYVSGWKDATTESLAMIVGGEATEGGKQAPVLYNGTFADPWGMPYQYTIKRVVEQARKKSGTIVTAPILPNFNRLADDEKR